MKRIAHIWMALVVFTIISGPVPCRSTEPEQFFDKGLLWLALNQDPETGSWGNDPLRETAIVLEALAHIDRYSTSTDAAAAFVEKSSPITVDHLCRKIQALSSINMPVNEDIKVLINNQNPDGGFGFAKGYPSSLVDSLLAAEAFQKAGFYDQMVIGKLLYYLTRHQGVDGGFSYAPEGPSSLLLTAHALRIFTAFQPCFNLAPYCDRASEFVTSYQDSQGGFGEGDSTVMETALCLIALHAAGCEAALVKRGRQFLMNRQHESGSWEDDPAATALALEALRRSVDIERPNLVIDVSSIEIDPAVPVAGQQVTLRCRVKNNGLSDAAHIKVRLYDHYPEKNGLCYAETLLDVLPAGESSVVKMVWTMKEGNGQTLLYVAIDPDNDIFETNELDNISAVSFTVCSRPDLVFEQSACVFDTAIPRARETFTLKAIIRNTGEADTGPVRVACRVNGDAYPFTDGVEAGEIVFANISGGGYAQAYFSLNLPEGNYTVSICIDPENTVEESNEGNNVIAKSVRVLPSGFQGVDLSISESSISFQPVEGQEGLPVKITADVRNSGDCDARDVTVALYDGDSDGSAQMLARHVFPTIRAQESGRLTLTAEFSRGDHLISLVIDPEGMQDEISTTNNRVSRKLYIHPAEAVVDLETAREDIWFDPPAPEEGQMVKVYCKVRNKGTVDLKNVPVCVCYGNPDIEMRPLDQRYPRFIIPSIDAGCSTTLILYYDTTQRVGSHVVTVLVDPDNIFHEAQEDNNRATATVLVHGNEGPDCEVADIITIPEKPFPGDMLFIRARIRNNGSRDSGLFIVSYELDGVFLGFTTIDSLAPGESAVAEFIWDSTGMAGMKKITISVDPDNLVSEINEFNNRATANISLSAPDLVISPDDVDIKPTEPPPGSTATVTCRVQNIGNIESPACKVALYQNTIGERGEIVAVNDIDAISPGQSAATSFNWHVPENIGSWKLYVSADDDNRVTEENELNNTAVRTVLIENPADVVVDGAYVTLTPEHPTIGDSILLQALVENRGGVPANNVQVKVWDGEPFDNASKVLHEQTVARLNAGAQVTCAKALYLEEGTHKLCIEATTDSPQSESRIDNNKACVDLQVSSVDDIEVRSQEMDVAPLRPARGDTISVSAILRNKSMRAIDRVTVRFYDGKPAQLSRKLGEDTIVALEPGGAERAMTSFVPVYGGMHELWVVVDPENEIQEDSKENNRACRQVVIESPEPDLALPQGSLTFSPLKPSAGDVVTLNARIGNYGSTGVCQVAVRFYEEDNGNCRLIGEATAERIDPNSMVSVSIPWVSGEGAYRIRAEVDPDNRIAESYEENNDSEIMVQIGGAEILHDDCGNSASEPHLVRGEDGFLETLKSRVSNVAATVSRDTDVVVYRYCGLQPACAYDVVVGYVQEPGAGIVQRLVADGEILHEALSLPESILRYYTYQIPSAIYQDGTIELSFERVSGEGAMVSEIFLVRRTGKKERATKEGVQWLVQPQRRASDGEGLLPWTRSQGAGLALQALCAAGSGETRDLSR